MKPPVPDDLSREEQEKLWAWVQKHHHYLSRGQVRSYVNECLAHHAGTGNPRGWRDWTAVARLWITRAERWKDQQRIARPELPQDHRDTGQVIDLAQRRGLK